MPIELNKRTHGGINIPFGARVITGTARAINGQELEQGVRNLIARMRSGRAHV